VGDDLVGMTQGILLFYDARHGKLIWETDQGKNTKGIKERKSGVRDEDTKNTPP
jgi:hypothetical protein